MRQRREKSEAAATVAALGAAEEHAQVEWIAYLGRAVQVGSIKPRVESVYGFSA
jgi:hypothetical protein